MCIELVIMQLRFPVVGGGSTTFSGQPSYISVLLAHRRPSGSSVLLLCEQSREIPILLPLVIDPLIRQTFKTVFEWPRQRFWWALRPADSP